MRQESSVSKEAAMKKLILAGGIFGLLSVAIGAFGAHALKATLTANDTTTIFQTGVQYQMAHALALLLVGLLHAQLTPNRHLRLVGWLFTAGIIVFSGSLYLLALTNIKIFGAITPIGGVCFLVGWFLMILTAAQSQTRGNDNGNPNY